MKKPILISSAANQIFKDILQLGEAKGIKKQKRFLVAGKKIVEEIFHHRPEQVEAVIVPENCEEQLPKVEQQIILAKPLFSQIDQFGTHSPLALCRLPDLPQWNPQDVPQELEVLLTQGDPANLGAAVRSCVAFGAKRIVILKEAAHPFHPKAIRAGAGANLYAPLCSGPSLGELEKITGPLIQLDMSGADLSQFPWPVHVRVLVGEEGPGLPESLSGIKVRIPMSETIESLNATVALSVALYSYRLKTGTLSC